MYYNISIDNNGNIILTKTKEEKDTLCDKYEHNNDIICMEYECVINSSYLETNNIIPIRYINVMLRRPLREILIIRFMEVIELNMINGTKGKKCVYIDIDDKLEKIGMKDEDETLKDIIRRMDVVINELVKEYDYENREKYKDFLDAYKIPENIISFKDIEIED
jgi:hypothetical protein